MGHKIGWAFDWKQRVRQFNTVALSALGGLRYEVNYAQQFDTARLAFHVEQKLLRNFDAHRHKSNREVLTGIEPKAIEDAWNRTITAAMLGQPL